MITDAFEVLGEDRPSRWLVTCDHASNRVPTFVAGGDLGVPPDDMGRHIAYDVGAAGLAARLAVKPLRSGDPDTVFASGDRPQPG